MNTREVSRVTIRGIPPERTIRGRVAAAPRISLCTSEPKRTHESHAAINMGTVQPLPSVVA